MENTLVSSTIVQHSIKGVYDLKKIVVNNISATATQIEKTYGELIYSYIMNKINTLLSSNNIIKMPILYHDNIYFIERFTESPINNTLQKRYKNINIYTIYDGKKDSIVPIVKINNKIMYLTPEEVIGNQITTEFFCNFILKKTKDIITMLNNHLLNHNICIKKAQLEFNCKL